MVDPCPIRTYGLLDVATDAVIADPRRIDLYDPWLKAKILSELERREPDICKKSMEYLNKKHEVRTLYGQNEILRRVDCSDPRSVATIAAIFGYLPTSIYHELQQNQRPTSEYSELLEDYGNDPRVVATVCRTNCDQ